MKLTPYLLAGCLLLSMNACKSKQRVTEIPAGGQKVATTQTTTAPQATAASTAKEETRSEKFEVVSTDVKEVVNGRYHIIVGSFGSADNATNLQSKLRLQGLKAGIVRNDAGMYRVIYASYNDYASARAMANELRAGAYKDAWILVQR